MSTNQPEINPNNPLAGVGKSIDRDGFLVLLWVLFSIATLFFLLRLVVRWRQNSCFVVDDYCMSFAWICLVAYVALQMQQMDALWYMTYLRSHRIAESDDTPRQEYELLRWQFPLIVIFWTLLWSVKASFMAVYYSIIRPLTLYRRLWYGVAVITALSYIACWVSVLLTCDSPGDYFAGNCHSEKETRRQRQSIIFSSTLDISTSLMIMALPVAILPSLQLDTRKKIGLGIAFSLGGITIGVTAVRLARALPGGGMDLLALAVWGCVEASAAVLVGSLLPLKALLSRRMRKYRSSGRMLVKSKGRSGHGSASTSITTRSTNTNTDTDTEERDHCGSAGSRTVMARAAAVLPIYEAHRDIRADRGIYVQRTYETHVELDRDLSSRDDDDEAIILKPPAHVRGGV
ncbi:hypothetical protein ACRALDRAFT_1083632 [Sodiomyces alcalophilus JCM 7366]|uniref:uncharacterized protein n=1 Tax=Sodiomyces alcalophilus JCM 7366 TaxID=591952 RepID=UPI0039B69150